MDTFRPTEWYDAYLFDLDGTIYLGDEILPGAKHTIQTLQERGIPVRFLSNNPTKTPDQYVDKLARYGRRGALKPHRERVLRRRSGRGGDRDGRRGCRRGSRHSDGRGRGRGRCGGGCGGRRLALR